MMSRGPVLDLLQSFYLKWPPATVLHQFFRMGFLFFPCYYPTLRWCASVSILYPLSVHFLQSCIQQQIRSKQKEYQATEGRSVSLMWNGAPLST